MRKRRKKTVGKLSGEESNAVAEEVSTDVRRRRMASVLKRDLSRYGGRKIAVIMYNDYVAEGIWIKDGGKKFLYEVDTELYDRDVVEDVLKKLGFKKVW